MRGISWLAADPVSFSRRTLLQGVSKYLSITTGRVAKHERTKKPTKYSRSKLNHSCVRKAWLECESLLSRRDLTLTTAILTGGLDVFILSIVASVSISFYRQLVLCVENPALMDVYRQPGKTLIEVDEGLSGWGRVGRAMPATAPRHVPSNWQKPLLHISADWSVKTPMLQKIRPADLQTRWVVTNHRWLQTPLGLHKCLAGCPTKGFPASTNFKLELPTSSLMWSVNTEPPNTRKGHMKYIYVILPTPDSGNCG